MKILLLVLPALLLVPGCNQATAPSSTAGVSDRGDVGWAHPDIGEPLATVGGVPIGTKEFDALALRQMGRGGDLTPEIRADVMDRLIKEKLLYVAALNEGIDRDPKIQKMMVNTLLKEDVYSGVRSGDLGEDELQAYFEAHIDDFVVPEKVQIKRILLKKGEGEDDAALKARTDELHATLSKHPEDFRALAQKHSQGPYARRGGELGFMTKDGKPGVESEVVAAAFGQAKGTMTAPFLTSAGWNIVYVPNRHERVERTFDQMRGSVIRKVKSAKYKDLYEGYVDGLRKATAIEIDDDKLAGHSVAVPEGGGYTKSGPMGVPGTGAADQAVVPTGADAIKVVPPGDHH
jgi:parvulin-like peptidyl-prolyl isomerase